VLYVVPGAIAGTYFWSGPPSAEPVHVLPNAEHADGHDVAASMHQPFLQLRELTGVTSPFEALQSQNQ
jgi:hypothetical protein